MNNQQSFDTGKLASHPVLPENKKKQVTSDDVQHFFVQLKPKKYVK